MPYSDRHWNHKPGSLVHVVAKVPEETSRILRMTAAINETTIPKVAAAWLEEAAAAKQKDLPLLPTRD